MKYLVTGGAGFIGSHLTRAILAAGDEAVVLDDLSSGKRRNIPAGARLIRGDVADPAVACEAAEGCDGIFHLAAVASVELCNQRWVESHRTNATGCVSAFEAARRVGAPVVWASSAAVYGDLDRDRISEEDPARPLTAYGADKLSGELHARPAALIHGVRSTALRFFNVYGPGQDPSSPYSGVIAIFADRIAAGREIVINGDGGQSRDFVFVGDVVRACRAAMRRMRDARAAGAPAQAETVNVCTGRPTTILDLAQTIARVQDRPAAISHGPARAGDIRRSRGNPAKLNTLLGVIAETDIETGLRELAMERV